MKDTIKVSELFGPTIQGEGKYVGTPSIFIRTFGCNFRCKSFGLPSSVVTTEVDPIIAQHKLKPYNSIKELPIVKTGCDTYFSIYPKLKSISKDLTPDEIIEEVKLLDGKNKSHIVITGGEPLLGWQKHYAELISRLYVAGYKHLTFETNGTQAISKEFGEYIANTLMDITFSVSPKLTNSGEYVDTALRPEIVKSYIQYGDVYLKFVVSDSNDMNDVSLFVKRYQEIGCNTDVYLMPCGGESELYNKNTKLVADLAIQYGYKFSPRLHISLYGNLHGT